MELDEYLKRHNVWFRVIHKPETIHTADAAKAANVDLKRLTKNLVAKTDKGEYVILIVPGDHRVNLKAAAKALGVRRVHLVPFNQAEEISGYPPGGTPSVGHKRRMRVVVDRSLLNYETVYCGGGRRDRILELKVKDIIRLNKALIADIKK